MTTKNSDLEFSPSQLRIIDANLNRLIEGIRVVEDIFRYALNHQALSKKLKTLRHQGRITELYEVLLLSRDAERDVLKSSQKSEQQRNSLNDIIIANFKRAQEASRVLEELLKLHEVQNSENFKQIRYALYTLEKEAFAYLKNLPE